MKDLVETNEIQQDIPTGKPTVVTSQVLLGGSQTIRLAAYEKKDKDGEYIIVSEEHGEWKNMTSHFHPPAIVGFVLGSMIGMALATLAVVPLALPAIFPIFFAPIAGVVGAMAGIGKFASVNNIGLGARKDIVNAYANYKTVMGTLSDFECEYCQIPQLKRRINHIPHEQQAQKLLEISTNSPLVYEPDNHILRLSPENLRERARVKLMRDLPGSPKSRAYLSSCGPLPASSLTDEFRKEMEGREHYAKYHATHKREYYGPV